MRSSCSKVAGWFVPARGTCSRKLSSPSASIRHTCTSACANASDTQTPPGPAPTTITRLEASMLARRMCREPASRMCASRATSILRGHHVLHGADPARVGEGEYDAERIPVLGLVVGVRSGARSRRLRPAGKILSARPHHLLLRLVELIHPHPHGINV